MPQGWTAVPESAPATTSAPGWAPVAPPPTTPANTFAIVNGQKVPLGTDEADLPPAEGFFTNKQTGERVFQSTISNDPAKAQQIAKNSNDWQWNPPSTPYQRGDRFIVGVPGDHGITPEDVLTGVTVARNVVLPVGRAVINAAPGALSRTAAAATASAPIVKYEVSKTVLTKLGVPEPLAVLIASRVSGWQGKGKGAAAPAAPSEAAEAAPAAPEVAAPPAASAAAPSEAVPPTRQQMPEGWRGGYRFRPGESVPSISAPVQTPVAPAPTAAPVTPPVAAAPIQTPVFTSPNPTPLVAPPPAAVAVPEPVAAAAPAVAAPAPLAGARATVWSPQRLQNELGLAARRVKVELTPQQFEQAATMVQAGRPPISAVQAVTTAPAAATTNLTPTEVQAFHVGKQGGLSDQEVKDVIQAARAAAPEAAQPLGTPRVLAWKPGQGPTQADAQKMSELYGSREAARRLKTTQDQIKTLRGASAAMPPQKLREVIDAALDTLKDDPAGLKAYVAAAPNPLVAAYLKFKLGLP